MERAIADEADISMWLWNGGAATLRSYGEEPSQWKRSSTRSDFVVRDKDFFSALELYVEDEHTIFVHAGINWQIRDMARQKPHDLLWIRERFYGADPFRGGKEIVFGHTPTSRMGLAEGETVRR